MKKVNKILLMVLFCATLINAQNFNDALRLTDDGVITSGRALGMGNAYLPIANDLSATYFNPAGIALNKNGELSGSFNYTGYANESSFWGNTIKDKTSGVKLNQIGVIAPVPTLRGSFAFAIGYNLKKDFTRTMSFSGFNSSQTSMIQDYAFSGNYDDQYFVYDLALSHHLKDRDGNILYDQYGVAFDSTFIKGNLKQSGTVAYTGGIGSWYFASAMEIMKDVFFGGTFNLLTGSLEKTSEYYEDDIKNIYPNSLRLDPSEPGSAGFNSFAKYDRLKWDIAGWDLKFGLLAKLDEKFTAGFTLQFPHKYTIKETFNVNGKSYFTSKDWSAYIDENKIEYDVSTPYEYAVGLSFHETNYTLSTSANFIDYSTMEFSSNNNKSFFNNKNQEISQMMKSVINFNVGGEYEFTNGLALRAGFMLKPSAFKDDPSDYDKKYITCGIGYKIQKDLQLNVGLAFGWWKDFGDNYGSGESRTYQSISTTNVVTTFRYSL